MTQDHDRTLQQALSLLQAIPTREQSLVQHAAVTAACHSLQAALFVARGDTPSAAHCRAKAVQHARQIR